MKIFEKDDVKKFSLLDNEFVVQTNKCHAWVSSYSIAVAKTNGEFIDPNTLFQTLDIKKFTWINVEDLPEIFSKDNIKNLDEDIVNYKIDNLLLLR